MDGKDRLRRWPVAVATATDRWLNATFLLGDDRQCVSSRAYFARKKGDWWGFVADWIDFIALKMGQADHCRKSAEFDAAVRQVLERKEP